MAFREEELAMYIALVDEYERKRKGKKKGKRGCRKK